MKNKRFLQDYKKRINDLMIKGYTKKSEMKPLRKNW